MAAPNADFVGNPTSGCAPLGVTFTDKSTGNPISWSWKFGDGGTSTAQHPKYTYNKPGVYTVSLTATNKCGSDTETKTDYITVNTPPNAEFTGTPRIGCGTLTVAFTDNSTGNPTSWSWDFGDGGTSTAQHPKYTYNKPGVYTVSLTATNKCGSDTETKTDYITVSGYISIEADKDIYHEGDPMTVETSICNPLNKTVQVRAKQRLVLFDGSIWPPSVIDVSLDLPPGFNETYVTFEHEGLPPIPQGTYTWVAELLYQGTIVAKDEHPWEYVGKSGNIANLNQFVPQFDFGDEIELANALYQNVPNPFNPDTWIPYRLKDDTDVTISIYDISGTLIRKLELGQKKAGRYITKGQAAYWDGRNRFGETVSSGIYFYTLQAGDYTATKQMLILK
jgi:chitodextrinase